MIWHLLKKDIRLLWPAALAVVLLQILCVFRTAVLSYFGEPTALDQLTSFLPYLVDLGVAVAAVAVMHEEPLPGVDEDWLVRPISRRTLALSKLLFVLLMVHAPLMLVDVGQQLTLHFSFWPSLGAATLRSMNLLFAISLPGLLLGAVTRTFVGAFVLAMASAIGCYLLFPLSLWALSPGKLLFRSQETGWLTVVFAGIALAVGATATLAYQYATRRTRVSTVLALTAVFAAACIFVGMPGAATLKIQELLWGGAGASDITLMLDPGRHAANIDSVRPLNSRGGPAVDPLSYAMAAELRQENRQIEKVRLPLRISGMRSGNVLFADRVDVRITAMNGAMLYQGVGACSRTTNGIGVHCSFNYLVVWAAAQTTPSTLSDETIYVPATVYDRIKDQSVRVEVTYVLTRFVARPSQSMRASADQRPLPEMGTCATRVDDDGDEIELGCLSSVGVPSCATAVLEDPYTKTRNPEIHLCRPNYAPFHRTGFEDVVDRSHLDIPFRDPSGLARYPVSSSEIHNARVVVTTYDPEEHFHRVLVIPSMRLADWKLPDGASEGN